MAEGLSAVAVKASPRAVASASWSTIRIPRPNAAQGNVRRAAMRRNRVFIVAVCIATIMLAGLLWGFYSVFFSSFTGQWQRNTDHSRLSFLGGGDFDLAVVVLDDFARDGESKAQADVAGGIEGLLRLVGRLGGEAAAGVAHL